MLNAPVQERTTTPPTLQSVRAVESTGWTGCYARTSLNILYYLPVLLSSSLALSSFPQVSQMCMLPIRG